MSPVTNGRDEHAGKKNADCSENSTKEQKDEPKSKSYAEILKGFEEIEKIFKRDSEKS